MIEIVGLICAILVLTSVVAALYRLFSGPEDADRALAADVVFFAAVAMFAIGGAVLGSKYIFDVVLVASITGFLATLALARAIMRGRR